MAELTISRSRLDRRIFGIIDGWDRAWSRFHTLLCDCTGTSLVIWAVFEGAQFSRRNESGQGPRAEEV